jgi:hypothetical protein
MGIFKSNGVIVTATKTAYRIGFESLYCRVVSDKYVRPNKKRPIGSWLHKSHLVRIKLKDDLASRTIINRDIKIHLQQKAVMAN